MRCRLILIFFATVLTLLIGPAAAADGLGYFKGKRVSILVSYEAGGAYDLYARLIAQFLGRHLPGEPTVIVQNMPGAGGLKAARYLLEVAPQDGTALGLLAQTMPFDTTLGYTQGVEAGRFHWIGRIAMNVEVGVARGASGIHSFNDARITQASVGGTGGTASSTVMPFLLNRLAGAKFRLVSGYRSAHDVLLAMERGEVDMVGSTGITTVTARWGSALKIGALKLIYLSALKRIPEFPDVPTIGELGRDDEGRQVLDFFASSSAIGRTLVAPPGVPHERIATLRKAMAATLADPALQAFASERNMPLEPASAAEVESIVRAVLATPKSITEKTAAVLQSMRSAK